nr:MAG TPA: hypothetical protein [Caudoviricetes sp.]
MAKIERSKDPVDPKKAKTKEKDSTTKLIVAVTGLNNTLDKNFKSITTALNELNKPKKGRRNNEEISIDKLKVEREKSISAFMERSQKLQENALRQRIQYAEENHKRYLEKNYSGDGIGSIPAKVYNNIKGQGSNVGSALALSLMTGGIVSPVIAKELGLDKIVTASAKFAGRTVSKATSTAWNMTGGLAWNNLKQPFTDPKSRLRKGLASGSNATSNFFKGGWANSLGNDDSKDGKQTGAVAKDKDKLSKLQKTVEDIKNYITKPKEQIQQQEKEKKKSLLDKLFEAIGGMGLILKGAAIAAIPYVVKEFLPKATEWLDEKFKGFLTGAVGLSDESSAGVSQLIKDALPGALFGMNVGGWRGALFGGALSLGINWLINKWDEFKNEANKEEIPSKIGPFDANTVQACLSGALLGSAFGWKGSLLGAALGFSADTLFNTVNDWKNILTGEGEIKNDLGNYFSGALTGAVSAMAIGKGTFNKKRVLMGAAIGVAIPWITQQVNDWKAILTGNGNKVSTENLGSDILAGAISGATAGMAGGPIGMAIGATVGAALPALKAAVANWSEVVKWLKSGLASIKQLAKDMIAHPIDTFKKLFNIGEDNEDAIKEGYEIGKADEKSKEAKNHVSLEMINTTSPMMEKVHQQMFDIRTENKEDSQGGGYGTLGTISKNSVLHGTKVTGLKSMGLKGSAVSSNSIPYIASQNEQSLKTLDQTLSDWGYEIIYTSAMGGHRAYTGHWKGNKVDLQLKKNGRPARLSSQQLNMLGQAGYWGRGTGALGWEPVLGQVGGGHYDLFIGEGSSGTALASAANVKLTTNDMPTSQETQVFAMNDMAETTQASAESMANSNGSILDMLGNMNDNISNNASSATGGAPIQSLDIPMPQSQNLALSMGSTQGRVGNQTNNVYAFGDVAKTPILYTL